VLRAAYQFARNARRYAPAFETETIVRRVKKEAHKPAGCSSGGTSKRVYWPSFTIVALTTRMLKQSIKRFIGGDATYDR